MQDPIGKILRLLPVREKDEAAPISIPVGGKSSINFLYIFLLLNILKFKTVIASAVLASVTLWAKDSKNTGTLFWGLIR